MLGVSHSGSIRALSLVVRVTGSKGNDLYVSAGGIRVLDKIGFGGTLEHVPQSALFADEENNVPCRTGGWDVRPPRARRRTDARPGALLSEGR